MKKSLLSVLALAAFGFSSCTSTTENNTTVNSDTTVIDPATTTTTTSVTRTIYKPIDENAEYVDLRSGNKFRIKRNDMGIYTTDAGADLEYYYNPATKDTFYMGEAYPVSGHLTRTGNDWSVDRTWFDTQYPNSYNPATMGSSASGTLPVTGEADKMRVEQDGDMKMKNNDGTIKEKLKVDGEGDDMKYKVKNKETGEKVKVTEDQIKVKDAQGNKTVIEKDGDVDGTRR